MSVPIRIIPLGEKKVRLAAFATAVPRAGDEITVGDTLAKVEFVRWTRDDSWCFEASIYLDRPIPNFRELAREGSYPIVGV